MSQAPAEAPQGVTPDPAQPAAPGAGSGMPRGPERDELVRQTAYRLYMERGGHAGQEADDWYAAEVIVDTQYAAAVAPVPAVTPTAPPVSTAAAADEKTAEPAVAPGGRFEIPVQAAAVEPVAAAEASQQAEAAPKPAAKRATTPPGPATTPAATPATARNAGPPPATGSAPGGAATGAATGAAKSASKSTAKTAAKAAAKTAPKPAPAEAGAAARPRKTKP